MDELTVIDLFCGAGGFSEGFRQLGFKIILGIDKWKPAVDTFNHNFGLQCKPGDVLDFETSVEKIEALPNSSVIIGSPPCVSFSSSNRSGKADKSLGIRLTEAFLRVVAIKKHQSNSVLKAWFMENVTKSISHLEPQYTFRSLQLTEWAINNEIDPDQVAISIHNNHAMINSADYGSAQARRRVISGELINQNRLVVPPPTHRAPDNVDISLPVHRSLGFIKDRLPKPNEQWSDRLVNDPVYPSLSIAQTQLTDHFYDTGLYLTEWKNSRFLKQNHPYMGFMSFPENNDKPSRTITATKIGTSREAIIYRSEYERTGDGEYRTPTVREAASLMGFPITYQFLGPEGAKWRLAGNAVCPSVSRTFAATVRAAYRHTAITTPLVVAEPILEGILDLNDFTKKKFNAQPVRNKGSRFRRHPFKYGNITVTLSNYDIERNEGEGLRWLTSVQYGNGEGFPCKPFEDNYFPSIERHIKRFPNGKKFLEVINNGFSEMIARSEILQSMYEMQIGRDGFLEPTALVEKVAAIIDDLSSDGLFDQHNVVVFPDKESVPQKQVMALYAINKICTIANSHPEPDHADPFH